MSCSQSAGDGHVDFLQACCRCRARRGERQEAPRAVRKAVVAETSDDELIAVVAIGQADETQHV